MTITMAFSNVGQVQPQAGAMGNEMKKVGFIIRNEIPFDDYLYKNYDISSKQCS
ncbi:hypothetical protein T12_1215 [Trichinella patagoniensis]|uniref:Uncharacterized protein n=1 Tax=Trichinella patagoniensis TaxID=990121 RepID=A0A0V0ZRB2_9BILA|nr:hypothetical protein T12_1215 [Trichinella patagoniensis]